VTSELQVLEMFGNMNDYEVLLIPVAEKPRKSGCDIVHASKA